MTGSTNVFLPLPRDGRVDEQRKIISLPMKRRGLRSFEEAIKFSGV